MRGARTTTVVAALVLALGGCGGVAAEGGPDQEQPAEAGGVDPAADGEGWRLLLSEMGASEPYRTGIATSQEQLVALLTEAGFGGRDGEVAVDFEREVAVWWGVAYGSTCNEYRFDGVVVEGETLAPVVTDRSGAEACTSDLAGGWGYVVAVERDLLPSGPFTVAYRLGDTPGALGEAATVVDGDLTVPGAIADATPYEPTRFDGAARDGAVIEPGFPWDYVAYVHCGVEALGTLNDVFWVARDGEVEPGVVPEAWRDGVVDDELVVEVVLEEGGQPTVTATANGYSVVYEPGDVADHLCD